MKDEWLKNFFTAMIILVVAMITFSLVGCSVEGYNITFT